MSPPLVVELFCGTFGWSQGWLDLGGRAVGFDIEHEAWHGPIPHGAELVLQDVRTLHGKQFKDAHLILSSSPCQEFSWRAMPWTAAKLAPPPHLGMELFAQAFRIQREASEAAGRWIPMVQENVRGAQKYVGKARWHFGSYYLWGDVPALMPATIKAAKVDGYAGFNHVEGRVGFNVAAVRQMKADATKNAVRDDRSWFGRSKTGEQTVRRDPRHYNRRAASAAIARIPYTLSRHIAETYWPSEYCEASA